MLVTLKKLKNMGKIKKEDMAEFLATYTITALVRESLLDKIRSFAFGEKDGDASKTTIRFVISEITQDREEDES